MIANHWHVLSWQHILTSYIKCNDNRIENIAQLEKFKFIRFRHRGLYCCGGHHYVQTFYFAQDKKTRTQRCNIRGEMLIIYLRCSHTERLSKHAERDHSRRRRMHAVYSNENTWDVRTQPRVRKRSLLIAALLPSMELLLLLLF